MSETVAEPTAEGVRRYPRTEGYFPELPAKEMLPNLDRPCTCTPDCMSRCGGECGCLACHLQFSVWREERGLTTADAAASDMPLQLKRYRGEVR